MNEECQRPFQVESPEETFARISGFKSKPGGDVGRNISCKEKRPHAKESIWYVFKNVKKAKHICHVGPYQPWAESGFYSKRQSLQKCKQKETDLRQTGVEEGRLV